MNIVNKKLVDIHPYEKNPRFNEDIIDTVANSIKEFGFRCLIVVDKDHVIICGYTRLSAAKKLGLEKVPVHIADNLTPEQVQAYRIGDNKTSEIVQWNYDPLPLEIKELQFLILRFQQEFPDRYGVDISGKLFFLIPGDDIFLVYSR